MNNDYVKVFSGSSIIVTLIIERLEEIGINPVIKDESESARMAGFGASIQNYQEVYVYKDELSKALPIVETIKAQITT